MADKTRSPKGSGTSITVELKDNAELLQKIRDAAQKDERQPSVWLRRKLEKLDEDGELWSE